MHSSLKQTPCCPSPPFQWHCPSNTYSLVSPAAADVLFPARVQQAKDILVRLRALGAIFCWPLPPPHPRQEREKRMGRCSSSSWVDEPPLSLSMHAGHIWTIRIKARPAINITSSTLCVLLLGYCTRMTSTNTTAISCTGRGLPDFRILAVMPRSIHRPLYNSDTTTQRPSLTPGGAQEPGRRSGCPRAGLAAAAGTWGDM